MNLEKIKQLCKGVRAISEWLGSGADAVDVTTAQARANICFECPKHDPEQNTTVLMGEQIRKVIQAKNKIGLTIHNEDKLGTCKVCGCVLKLQVFEPYELLERHTDKTLFPKHCWKLNP